MKIFNQILSNKSNDESVENRIIFGDGHSYDHKQGRLFEMPVPEDSALRLTEGSSGFYLQSIGSYDFSYEGKAGEAFDITVWQTEQRGSGMLSIGASSGSTLDWIQDSIVIDPATGSPPTSDKIGDTYNVSIQIAEHIRDTEIVLCSTAPYSCTSRNCRKSEMGSIYV